ncbi:MAG TPA: hypothetical protein VH969_09555 [Actinophytocola sp.]|jgi:hypothetical protein|uniref:hypothetical protein n=1 Tax=Actinophytocola sp. TaxID=1872138 RepID=UPI002F94E3EA
MAIAVIGVLALVVFAAGFWLGRRPRLDAEVRRELNYIRATARRCDHGALNPYPHANFIGDVGTSAF